MELNLRRLHYVGIGTFRNLREEDIQKGTLHHESFVVSEKCVEAIQSCKKRNGRVIAVGTTVTRTLESVFQQKTDGINGGANRYFIREV